MRTLFLVSVLFVACGPQGPQQLDGSLTSVVDVSYSRATLEVADGFLSLRFLKVRGETEDVVLKIGVIIDGKVPDHSVQYDLAEAMAGGQRGVATRNVLADPELTSFPPLMRGSFRADGDLTKATTVRGEVSLTFAQGDKVASGRAVFGAYEAEVVR